MICNPPRQNAPHSKHIVIENHGSFHEHVEKHPNAHHVAAAAGALFSSAVHVVCSTVYTYSFRFHLTTFTTRTCSSSSLTQNPCRSLSSQPLQFSSSVRPAWIGWMVCVLNSTTRLLRIFHVSIVHRTESNNKKQLNERNWNPTKMPLRLEPEYGLKHDGLYSCVYQIKWKIHHHQH